MTGCLSICENSEQTGVGFPTGEQALPSYKLPVGP